MALNRHHGNVSVTRTSILHSGTSGGEPSTGMIPTRVEAEALSVRLLATEGTRLAHVRTAGKVAERLSGLFPPEEHQLLVVSAILHDIGYAPALRQTGFHALDGALYLRDEGFSPRLARLVANHSHAWLTALDKDLHGVQQAFLPEHSLLADALAFVDMHSGTSGEIVDTGDRMTDIGARHNNASLQRRIGMLRASVARINVAIQDPGQHA